jgi:hypothetical protein
LLFLSAAKEKVNGMRVIYGGKENLGCELFAVKINAVDNCPLLSQEGIRVRLSK